MSEFESSKESALADLESLGAKDEFMLITRTSSGEYSYRHYSGDRSFEVSHSTLGSVPIRYLYENADGDDVTLDMAAEQVLKGARLHAQDMDVE
ncbi:hypothetical protein SAMN04488066_104113 [Halorubrum aquaticum]|uniref:Uncharacterized protein n=1 Tax=Halorubrum aquaticum TaxID=387340 RepID=A0A1I3A3H0_9EURY|nr:hypothetical protein [Halorubrum aquaticum]SFH44657.1 hypothetical protein SAMN04488066_104113 [Halorubrum aquaticum]